MRVVVQPYFTLLKWRPGDSASVKGSPPYPLFKSSHRGNRRPLWPTTVRGWARRIVLDKRGFGPVSPPPPPPLRGQQLRPRHEPNLEVWENLEKGGASSDVRNTEGGQMTRNSTRQFHVSNV
ncbi:hypothetical protein AAHC03_026924 [Spirometra sp. Aus1]